VTTSNSCIDKKYPPPPPLFTLIKGIRHTTPTRNKKKRDRLFIRLGGWGAIRYSLKMAHRACGLWPILKALTSRNNFKSCTLGMVDRQVECVMKKAISPLLAINFLWLKPQICKEPYRKIFSICLISTLFQCSLLKNSN
jgi:hypothetical protein